MLQGEQGAGRSWARDLELHEYAHLSVEQRLDALLALVHLAADSPSIRSAIELRIEEAHRMKRVLADEAKVGSQDRHATQPACGDSALVAAVVVVEGARLGRDQTWGPLCNLVHLVQETCEGSGSRAGLVEEPISA